MNRGEQEIKVNDPIEKWPRLDAGSLSAGDRDLYLQRCMVVQMFMEGIGAKEISEKYQISVSSIYYFRNRCMSLGEDGQILGFRALIPRVHLAGYTRTQVQKPKLPEAQGGCSGLFSALLKRFPEIEDELLMRINKEKRKHLIHEHKIRAVTLHRIFLKLAEEKGVAKTEWPFNTKWLGRNTINRYLKNVLARNGITTAVNRGADEAKTNIRLGGTTSSLLSCEQPYEIFEADAHHIDCHATIAFGNPDGTFSYVLIERMWIVALICRASTAIISYRFVYRSEVGADDVLSLLRDAVNPDHLRPAPVISGLKYPATGGLPKEVIPECKGALWSSLMLDGALAHLAIKVRDRARKELGFSVNWGSPGAPARRSRVEHFFNVVSKDVFQRLASTTGSSPERGRAKKGAEMAVAYKITAGEIEHLLDVAAALHNATPAEGLFLLSPLEYITQKIEASKGGLLFRYLPSRKHSDSGHLFCAERLVTLRGDIKKGRLPYIQYEGVRYTSSVLRDLGDLISQKIKVSINESDLRQIQAFTTTGYPLGIIYATGKWSQSKHDLRTRKSIRSLISRRLLFLSNEQDPVQGYLEFLSKKNTGRGAGSGVRPSQATEANRVSKESGIELNFLECKDVISPAAPVTYVPESNNPALLSKPVPNLAKILRGRNG